MTRLMSQSSPQWLACVMADFPAFLADHANCERKAAAMAQSLVGRYPDKDHLVEAMLELAQEELAHFGQVFRILRARGLSLIPEDRDPYVGALRQHVRSSRPHQLLDHLCIAAVIESRGCERFGMIANAQPLGELRDFYTEITRSEARHGGLFARLAKIYYPPSDVDRRLEKLFDAETSIIASLQLRPRLH